MCCCGTRFGHSVDTILSVKIENFSGYGEDFTKVPPHRSETNGFVERAVRRTTEGTSAELLQPVLDEDGGLILWTAILICDMSKTSWRMEKTLRKALQRNI